MVRGPLLVAVLSACASTASSSFCDAGEDWHSIWADEFDGDLIDATKWTITVGAWPAASSAASAAAADRPLIDGKREHPHLSSLSPASGRWGVAAVAAPNAAAGFGADCHGDGCVILGSCRSAMCTADNAYLENGTLVLRSQRQEAQGLNYTTGAVNTRHKSTWTASPGAFRLCVSAKLPGGGGGQSGRGIWPAHWLMPDDDTCDPDEGEIDIMEMVDGAGTVCVRACVVACVRACVRPCARVRARM
jgi:beta-glucanase (GH16 family)